MHFQAKVQMHMGTDYISSPKMKMRLRRQMHFVPKWKCIWRGIFCHFCAKCIFAPSGKCTWALYLAICAINALSRQNENAPGAVYFAIFRENGQICRRFRRHVTRSGNAASYEYRVWEALRVVALVSRLWLIARVAIQRPIF